ncbi:MAG: hypothetical protein ACK4ZY_15335, partial [Sphingomonas sp.]
LRQAQGKRRMWSSRRRHALSPAVVRRPEWSPGCDIANIDKSNTLTETIQPHRFRIWYDDEKEPSGERG